MPGNIRHTNPSPVSIKVTKLPRKRWRKRLLKPEKAVSTLTCSPRIFLRKCKYNPPMRGPHTRMASAEVFAEESGPGDELATEPPIEPASPNNARISAVMPTSGQKSLRTKAQPRRRQLRMSKV